MNIDPPDTSTKETLAVDETQQLVLLDQRSSWKRCQKGEHLGSVAEVHTSEFANDERMDRDDPSLQMFPEARFAFTQMLDPDRSVDDHAEGRRRRGGARAGSEPPKAASRRALSRSTNAWRPA